VRLNLASLPGLTLLFQKTANFRPYSYWKLVSLCYPIAQHICTIFIFLATFVRIKERILDPRLLVWVSTFAFILGYLVWQLVEVQLANKFHQARKLTNRKSCDIPPFPSPCIETVVSARFGRRENCKIFHIGVPCTVVVIACDEDADGIHLLGFDLGTCCVPVHLQCVDCGLQCSASRDLHARKVRPRPLCYIQTLKWSSDCWSSSLTSVLSINAAISASVVLASRLPDDISVFALMLYAVVMFAMFPVLRHRLQVRPLFG